MLAPQIAFAVAHITEKERKALLSQWAARLKNIFDEDALPFIPLSHYTEGKKQQVPAEDLEKQPFIIGQHGGNRPIIPGSMYSAQKLPRN